MEYFEFYLLRKEEWRQDVTKQREEIILLKSLYEIPLYHTILLI